MKYTDLTPAQRRELPDTYGIPKYCANTMKDDAQLWQHGNTYDLTFEAVTQEMNTAFDIGLHNYGSGRANWVIPDILKARKGTNKRAQTLHLYIHQVCGAYTAAQVNKFWKSLDQEQQDHINTEIDDYLDYCTEYLQDNF